MDDFLKEVDDYIDHVIEVVEEHQIKTAEIILGSLYAKSPHIGTSEGGESEGEYDANHYIVINRKDDHEHLGPQGLKSGSVIDAQQQYARNNLVLGDFFMITNDTEHDKEVEHGADMGYWPVTAGYKPYALTKEVVKDYLKYEYEI